MGTAVDGLVLLIIGALLIAGPVALIVVGYKLASGFLAEMQSDREEAERERKEAENDNLRLQMLRERRMRLAPASPPATPAEQVVPQPDSPDS